jgi:pSer/pThr/pTyr-binding forkhead associated (FHA) protein
MSRTSASQPTTPSALPSLVPHGRFKGKPGISLSRPVTVVGSRNRAHIHLVSQQVSKSHAMVVNGGSAGCYVRDLASRTHVLVNGQQVKEAELKDGDVLGIGPFTFRFTDPNKKPRRRGGVQTNVAAGVLRISTRTLPFALDARTTLIGRRPTCDVAVDDMDVSTTHAVVFELDGKRYIRDLGSRTGTFVNGTAIHQQAIEFGDEIKIGAATMTYADAGELGIGSGLGSDLHDGTEDLAATAHLPAVDAPLDLVFDEPPAAKPARPARPVRKAPAAAVPPPPPPIPVEPVEEIAEVAEVVEPVEAVVEPASVEPALPEPVASELDLEPAPQAPADVDELDLAALDPTAEAETPADIDELDLATLELTAEAETPAAADVPALIEPSQESALGIELLPHDEEHAAAAAAPVADAPQAQPADVGGIEDLDLTPVAPAPAEAGPPAPVVEAPAFAPAPAPAPEPAVAERDVDELPELPPALAEELELEPVDLDDIEVLAKTEPTPESALDLDRALPGAAGAPLEPQAVDAPATPPAELLSDSMFGREVEAFGGPGTGPIVEAPTAAAAAEAPAPEAPVPEAPAPAAAAETPAVEALGGAVEPPVELMPSAESAIEPEVDALIFEEPAAAQAIAAEPIAPEVEASPAAAIAPEVEAASPPPLTLDHLATPSQAEPIGAVESPVEPALPVDEAAEPAVELDLAPLSPATTADFAPATPDHEPAPAEPDLAATLPETFAESASPVDEAIFDVPSIAGPSAEAPAAEAEIETEPAISPESLIAETPAAEQIELETPSAIEPAAEAPIAGIPVADEPIAEIPAAEEAVAEQPLDVESVAEEPLAEEEPVSEAPAVSEAEPTVAAIEEILPSAEELAKAEDAVEKWYREHAEHPETIVRPEGIPAAAEPTAPLELAEAEAGVDGESAVPAEPFPIDPELLGEDVESSSAATPDPLVFQESEAPVDAPADAELLSIDAPVAPAADEPIAPEADMPATAAAPTHAPAAEAPAPGQPDNLFFGLERDTASFLGGMPLQLPPLQTPFGQQRVDFARPAAPAAASQPAAPAPQPAAPAPQPQAEEPLPDFDHEAFEYPDEPAAAAPTAEAVEPAALAPEAPAAPVAPAAGRSARPAPPPPARSRERQPRDRDRDRQGAQEPPQAPARRVASSPFDLNFEDVPTDRIEIPPFGGTPASATRGQVTTAFDGLAMPPVRETDVFSNREPGGTAAGVPAIPAFPGAASSRDDESFDDDEEGAGEDLDALDLSDAELADDADSENVPAGDASRPGMDSLAGAGQSPAAATAAATAAAAAAAAAESRRARPLAQSNRRPPAYPSDPAAAPGAPARKKKRWRIGKWGIFGLMMICMIAVSGGMLLYQKTHPNTGKVFATVRFEKLDALTEAERQKVLAEQRAKLSKPEVRTAARNILPGIQANLPAGFLDDRGAPGQASAIAFSKFADTLTLDTRNKGEMDLQHATSDPSGDAFRVRAVLAALYAENKPLIDAKGEIDHARDEKQEALRNAQAKLTQLEASIAAARQAAGDGTAVTEKEEMIAGLLAQQNKLRQAWYEKTAAAQRASAELRVAESDVPLADAAKQPVHPDEDEQVVELTRKAEALAAELKAKKSDATAKADAARKSLAGAIKQFEDDIAKARGEMKPDSELVRYLDQAERVHSQLKIISGELDARQRSDMERLTTLKRNLSEANESRIREAFAADPDLKKIQQTLAMKERQRNSAAGGGLKDDERALAKEITALKLEVESRQDLLTTADGVAPRMKQLENLINDFLKQMDQDRVRNDQRMAELLKQLASQAPVAGSLPKEQKAFAEQLTKRQAELNKARERYAAAADAAAAESDAQLKGMEGDLAAAQAKVDERKKQVADAARAELSAEQQKDRTAITEALRHKLAIAQREDGEAGEAFNKNRQALEEAKSGLEQAKRSAQQFVKLDVEQRQLTDEIKTLSDEVERLTKQQDAAIIPVRPDEDAVEAKLASADNWLAYMLGALLATVLVFLVPLIMAPSHPELADDYAAEGDGFPVVDAYGNELPAETIDDVSDLPFVSPTAPDDAALAAALKVETATDAATPPRDRTGRSSPAPMGA